MTRATRDVRGNGGDAPARAIHRSAGLFGFEGTESLASPAVIPRVSWLVALNMRRASLGTPGNTLHSDARDGGGRGITGKLFGLPVAGLYGRGWRCSPLRVRFRTPRRPEIVDSERFYSP